MKLFDLLYETLIANVDPRVWVYIKFKYDPYLYFFNNGQKIGTKNTNTNPHSPLPPNMNDGIVLLLLQE